MPASEKFKRINNWANNHSGLIKLAALVLTAIGVVVAVTSAVGPWLLAKLASFITFASTLLVVAREYSEIGVWSGLGLILMGLLLRLRTVGWRLGSLEKNIVEVVRGTEEMRRLGARLDSLERQTIILLDKSRAADLASWDYRGEWSLDGQELAVTNSDEGGLLKWGSAWENYDLIFSFRIVDQCAGWIVRGEHFGPCVMIQCTSSRLRPHTRKRLSALRDPDPERGFELVTDMAHGLSLKEWNTAKTEVRGYAIRVFINERQVFSDPELLRGFPLGRVGFRCSGGEHARFKDVEVIQRAGCSIY
ncbi:MAG: hypothetical protein HY913_07565 [Desulfomonile tiedjei]|nr:hypothetical protein [Desulfomonile tiedjei]